MKTLKVQEFEIEVMFPIKKVIGETLNFERNPE